MAVSTNWETEVLAGSDRLLLSSARTMPEDLQHFAYSSQGLNHLVAVMDGRGGFS